jgi:crotonobetainyl-CoA:carnitine CoA-transferase CaiB-like acyl-CoA transferase
MSTGRPLSGIRVLDVSRTVAGPTCCFWLASLGAEVIRVESPDGDMGWRTFPRVGPEGDHYGPLGARDIPMSPLRKQRGKRSVVLDLTVEAGRDVLRRLAAVSDVLVENMKPGTMQAWGLSWESLEPLNPRLVYACITGYGLEGPYRDKPAMDPVVQAVSGVMARTGSSDGPPTRFGATVGDQLPGVWAALGVLAALRQRDLDGRGQLVDVAMLDALLAMSWDDPLDLYEDEGMPERFGGGDPRGGPFGVYPTSDGWVSIVAAGDGQWRRLAPLIGGDALDERWTVHRTRALQRDELDTIVTDWCQKQLTQDVVTALEQIRVPVGPVNPPWWARHDPHVAQRGTLERLRHPDRDEPTAWLGPRLPVHFSRAAVDTTPAEPLGASTDAVMRELLGLDDDAVAALQAGGAFGPDS